MELVKPQNPCDFELVNGLFDYCNTLGVLVKAYLMLGFPWETEDIIRDYLSYVSRLRANQIKVSYFTPFPGTPAWNQYKDQLVTHDWSHFDTVSMPVVFNPRISVAQYNAIRRELFQTFYGSPTYYDVTVAMLRRFPHYIDSYREFVDYLRAFDMITGREAWLELLGLNREVVAATSHATVGEASACS